MSTVGEPGGGVDRFWLGPLIGLMALAVLGGAYLLVVHLRPKTKPTATLLHFAVSQVVQLHFHAHGKDLVLVYNTPQGQAATWDLASAGGPSADQSLVQSFLSDLVTLSASRTLLNTATGTQLQTFGLQPADSSVTMTRGNGLSTLTLDVGATAPTGEYYARVNATGAVYLIAGLVPGEISADPTAWLPLSSSSSSSGSASASASAATPTSSTASASTASGGSAASSASSSGSAGASG